MFFTGGKFYRLPVLAFFGAFALHGCGTAGSSPSVPASASDASSNAGHRTTGSSAPMVTLWGLVAGGGINQNGEIIAYDVSTTATTATLVPKSAYSEARPAIDFNPAGINSPQQLAFDRAGRLWVANQASNLIVSFTINPPGTPPTLNLNSGLDLPYPSNYQPQPGPYVDGPYFVAYDAATNSVWTLAYNSFPHSLQDSAIGSSGALTSLPVKVTGTGFLNNLSFDKNGVLWGTGGYFGGIGEAFSVSGSNLTAVPNSQIATPGGQIVFDSASHIWFADLTETPQANTPPKVHEFTDPGVSGAPPTPIASFSVAPAPSGTHRFIYPIGFDAAGNLWLQAVDEDDVSGLPDDSKLLAYAVSAAPKLLTTIPLPPGGFSFPGGFVIQP